MTVFFSSKNSHCDLDLNPRTLKLELVKDIVILNICVIQNQNNPKKRHWSDDKDFLKIVTTILTLTLSC